MAPASVAAADWLAALACRAPLVLTPSADSGWFGGLSLVAVDPVESGSERGTSPEALRAVGAVLDEAVRAQHPVVCAALVPYSGDIRWERYERGLVLCDAGWRPWGDWTGVEPLAAPPRCEPPAGPLVCDVASDTDEGGYVGAVAALRERILAGDVYVLNLTRRLAGRLLASPGELLAALTAGSDASMAAAWLPAGGCGLVSASPERFLRMSEDVAEIMPVKGTRPRGSTAGADEGFVADLRGSAKEKSEHVMIVDLVRNDLGRVCEPGSISVDPLMAIESTPYCHQMVSVVRGRPVPGAGVGALLEATFPCGSVTGAPKIAAMRIAGELEAGPRGDYTGSLLVALPGALDSSVIIRSVETDGTTFRYGTGGGITIDSDPREEWEESVLKTRPLLGQTPPVALRETCRLVGGRVPLWPYHRARLASGGCGRGVRDAAEREVLETAAAWEGPESSRVRLTVVVTPEGVVQVSIERRLSSLDVPAGPRIALVDVAAPPVLPPGAAKPADRSYWDEAQRRAKAFGADIAVLVGPDGLIIDGGTSTLWLAFDTRVVTPLAPPAVAGVSRAFLLDALACAGTPAYVEPVSAAMLEEADEVFLTNAFGGAACVRGRGPGPVFTRVAAIFDEMWRR